MSKKKKQVYKYCPRTGMELRVGRIERFFVWFGMLIMGRVR